MKRVVTILGILAAGTVAFGLMRSRVQSVARTADELEAQHKVLESRLVQAEAEQKVLREATAKPASVEKSNPSEQFSPALTQWLVAGDFTTIPAALVPELRTCLGLADDTTSDYVLISKPTMETLRPRSPGKNDKLSDGLCALLSIGPEQRSRIEGALAGARKEFADWAKENVVRETPGGEAVVRYTLPAANDFADGLTNRLLETVSDAIGRERASLLRTYAEDWFQIEMGYLGGVTNTLAVLRKPNENGRQALYYRLSREGSGSSMSEGPGEINPSFFPPAWRNIFPGGWAEVAEREGLELPAEPKSTGK
jgi:hypothetical protein